MAVLDELRPGARLAVVRLRSLGDCVLTTPALEILKRFQPHLSVAVVVEPRFAAIFEGNPDVAAILEPRQLRRWKPEVCLNLHGGTRSMWLTGTSGARLRAGFAHHRYSRLYHVRIPTAQQILGVARKVHTAEHLASAMFHLGVPLTHIPRARLFCEATDAGRYAVLHPMASAPEKTWPAERFRAVAAHLRDHGMEPVFIAGANEDTAAFAPYNVMSGAPLAEVKSLIAGAGLFVGNDSGPAHMAAALGVPVVVIFAASDPEIWGPWRAGAAEVLTGAASVKDVLAAIERLKVTA